jgi:hypothetical protein
MPNVKSLTFEVAGCNLVQRTESERLWMSAERVALREAAVMVAEPDGWPIEPQAESRPCETTRICGRCTRRRGSAGCRRTTRASTPPSRSTPSPSPAPAWLASSPRRGSGRMRGRSRIAPR